MADGGYFGDFGGLVPAVPFSLIAMSDDAGLEHDVPLHRGAACALDDGVVLTWLSSVAGLKVAVAGAAGACAQAAVDAISSAAPNVLTIIPFSPVSYRRG